MKTQYVSRKKLLKQLDTITDYFMRNSADWILKTYPHCKYYIFDGANETLKPSKRR